MVNYRTHFRDLDGWFAHGIPLTTPSNKAAKLYDAALDQMVYYYDNPQLGGLGETIQQMLAEDPGFVSGNLLRLSLELFMTSSAETREKFDKYCATLGEGITEWEKMHVSAARCLYAEDLIGAMEQYAAIAVRYPHDIHGFNIGFILGLVTGQTSYLRDVPLSVVEKYKPDMPHYGLVHGKLCFGHAEMGEYESAKRCGNIALEAFPLDSWAVHAMAHMYENQAKPKEEISFLEETSKHWTRGVNFSHHIHWHHANAYAQIQDYDSALAVYDTQFMRGSCLSPGNVFPLSDASSFLMRMKIDGHDIADRHISVAEMWSKSGSNFTSLFYDAHSAFTAAMVGDTTAISQLRGEMEEYIASDRTGWNKVVTSKYGLDFIDGMKHLADEDYAEATEKLARSVPHVIKVIHGSKAQKSIFSLIYIYCAILSGDKKHLEQAQEHMEELMRWNKVTSLPPLQQRLWNRIQRQHDDH